MPSRVLLVHANPMQRVVPVPPYGLERLASAAESAGADVRLLDPYLLADDPPGDAARVAAAVRPDVIGLGLRVLEDCIPVDGLEGPDDQVDVHSVLPEVRELSRRLAEAAPQSLLLLGGAGFSAAPQECLEYLEVEWGVVGAGEAALRALLRRLRAGEPLDGVPGLVRRGDGGPAESYQAEQDGAPPLREPLYAPVHGIPVRARTGCAMACSYCTAATLARRHSVAGIEAVVDEIEVAVDGASARGVPTTPIFLCADELNLPGAEPAMELLSRLIERGLAERITWRAYVNPTPFPDELARLVAATGGHLSVTVDSASDAVLERNGKPFRRRHLERLLALVEGHRLSADLGLIFGLPGETEATLAETVELVRGLPPSLDVVYAAGARVYPHTPLAAIAAAEPGRVYRGVEAGPLTPRVYSALGPPRLLARRLAHAFADRPQVQLLGVAYARASRALAGAYRVVERGEARAAWDEVLHEAASARDAPAQLRGCLEVALWHRRFDLAASACRALLAQAPQPGLDAGALRRARRTYAALGLARRLASLTRS